jgi:HSP20 family protein
MHVRVLPLPVEVMGTEAKATYKNGVLEIKIPKSKKEKSGTIKVQVAA